MARPVFWSREVGSGRRSGVALPSAVGAADAGRVGATPKRDLRIGRWSGSRRVSMAKVKVSSSTS